MRTYVPAEDAIGYAPGERTLDGADDSRRLTLMLLVNGLVAGGPEQQFVELARGLDKSRFRVLITTLCSSTLLEDELRDSPEIELHSLGSRGRWDPMALPSLVSLLKRERVDIIQPFSTPATTFGFAAAIIARTPLKIATERSGRVLNEGLGGRLWRFLEDRLVRRADAIVHDSESGARGLIARGIRSEKVHVIYDGVAQERLRTNLPERQALRSELGVLDESWLIGVAAGLTDAVDYGCFLQAASIVRAEVPGTKFLIVGDGSLPELQRRAKILGLDGSVIFAGTPPRVAPYIGAMDVAVLSPADGETSADFGLEAMGLGRPIVATDVGSNRELFPMGEAGLIVPPDNPIILAHAILEVMRHPDAVDRMRERGREIFSERFTLKRMIASYEELYSDAWTATRRSGRANSRSRPASTRGC
jgi:glycosyltransferase involved in cell wall biosynthesis